MSLSKDKVGQRFADLYSEAIHEFRTPLTLMLGPLEYLLEKIPERGFNPEDLSRLAMAHRNALRLQKLVNALLDFSRLEVGMMQPVFQPTDLAAFTLMLAANFRSLIENSGLKFRVKCTSRELVYVNRDMWEKILMNLLSNAYKFTFSGGVTVSVKERKKHVRLSVKDTGVGIPSHDIDRVFERFVRIESRSRTKEGTGLGLFMLNEFVKIHGGRTKVKSKVGTGTEFIITIPKGKAHLPLTSIHEHNEPLNPLHPSGAYVLEGDLGQSRSALDADAGSRSSLNRTQEAAGQKPMILYAEDDYDMREYVRHILSGRYEVIAVSNGQMAWEIISESFVPDLILLDVLMPGLDGIGILKRLRARDLTARLPVILLSSRASEEDCVDGIENGADDYIRKPFSRKEFVARIEALLRKS